MTKRYWPFFILSFVFVLFFRSSYSQDFTGNSIKVGFGVGASMGLQNDGLGFIYSVGYQREIWRDRLRLNPNFSIGHYSSRFIQDARDQYFNSINLETNLFFDLIKIGSFSIVIGTGLTLNNSRGLKGTGGDSDYTGTVYSEYFSEFYVGGLMSTGIRVNSPNRRRSINILPINIHVGNNYFMEQHAKIELDFKF